MFKHYAVLSLNEMTHGKYFDSTSPIERVQYILASIIILLLYTDIYIPVKNYQLSLSIN